LKNDVKGLNEFKNEETDGSYEPLPEPEEIKPDEVTEDYYEAG